MARWHRDRNGVGDLDGEDLPTKDGYTYVRPDDVVCECGSRSFHLAFTGKYELTAECAGCGARGVIYDG